MTVCLDTSVFLQIFGRKQPYHRLLRAILEGQMTLVVSTGILLEYEEMTVKIAGAERWREIAALLELVSRLHGNIQHVESQFRFGVIAADADDNKFCDCAIAAAADFLVTEDRHFNV